MRSRRTLLVAVLLALLAGHIVATPLATAAPGTDYVLHVEAGAPANEHTDGSEARPFPTIEWAVALGQYLRKQGDAVRIVVAPGTYRETVTVGWGGDEPPPLVIEAEVAGEAVVSGADVETRWSPVAGTSHVQAPWPHDWGLTPVPIGWSGVTVPDGIRRREAVFIDGEPLVQVLSRDDLTSGSFFVDEDADQLVVHPPAGVTDMDEHLVEVAQREFALRIQGNAAGIAVRDLVFEAAATPLEKFMGYITDATDVVVEGNTFRHSSWGGLGICCTEGITIRDNHSHDNGGNGIDTFRTARALIENNLITGNNVRGHRHGYTGWSVAGSKHLLLADTVFRDNTYTGNLARGLWLDTDVQDVLVDGDRSCGNLGDGLFVEATQGPLRIRDSTFCNNGRAGITVGTSGNVTLQGSTLANNPYGQLVFTGERRRSWIDRLTGGLVEMGDFSNWTLVNNTFRATDGAHVIYSPVIPIDEWRELLRDGEIEADGNTWIRPSMDAAIRIQATDFPMSEWRALTGDTPPDPDPDPEHRFTDIDGNDHEAAIAAIAAEGITGGCSPDGTRYCPATPVRRDQMASFLRRALDLPASGKDHFPDDEGNDHEESINRIADAGITVGRDGRFEPSEAVTRAQMASFLARGFDLPPANPSFTDVGPPHDQAIGAIEAEGITGGCTPDGTRYCPTMAVRRDQMASFLGRALDLGI